MQKFFREVNSRRQGILEWKGMVASQFVQAAWMAVIVFLVPVTNTVSAQVPIASFARSDGSIKRGSDGDGTVTLSGELKRWHNVVISLDGPFAHERDTAPNPFTDMRFDVRLTHETGEPSYLVPGYFAADGDSGNTSAESGTIWRAHLAPDRTGVWNYEILFRRAKLAALDRDANAEAVAPFDGLRGHFEVLESDKSGRDFRAQGRLRYVGKRYLQFAGSKKFFLKAGADAPETLLGYVDFDGTEARRANVPLKTWNPHRSDWQAGDPVWKGGRGKGLIGAINYLSETGCNAFSFLTYNAGGDGDNVWPFVERDDPLHYDCSKLDQWGIVFSHGTHRGMYLHFKMQETENDDDRRGKKSSGKVAESLDGGDLGVQRKLYCRELVARYAHELALNWNLGEENTQTTEQQREMAAYIHELDPYSHNIVVHTYPNEQDKVYRPLLGDGSVLTGASLQNSHIRDTHWQTVKWVNASAAAGKPWIVAFDESGSAAHGQPPDLGYRQFDGRDNDGETAYTQHEVRRQTLWGVLMAGGAGVEYYFGYKFAENDLVCEDWRSRDQSWNDCRIALGFFQQHEIPFWRMTNADQLVGNLQHDNSYYCFADLGREYLVYLPRGGSVDLDLSGVDGDFTIRWFNPRLGGAMKSGSVSTVNGGRVQAIGRPPVDDEEDWVAVIKRS